MRKCVNKRGFTLIELLAVIVILGVVMAIAIPSVTRYIENSKKDAMISSAELFLESARTMLIAENELPAVGEAVIIPIDEIELQKGGVSPYTGEEFSTNNNKSYIIVYNKAQGSSSASADDYIYAIALDDGSKSCMQLASERYLLSSDTKDKRALITSTTNCTDIAAATSAGVEFADANIHLVTGNESFPTLEGGTKIGFNQAQIKVYSK